MATPTDSEIEALYSEVLGEVLAFLMLASPAWAELFVVPVPNNTSVRSARFEFQFEFAEMNGHGCFAHPRQLPSSRKYHRPLP